MKGKKRIVYRNKLNKKEKEGSESYVWETDYELRIATEKIKFVTKYFYSNIIDKNVNLRYVKGLIFTQLLDDPIGVIGSITSLAGNATGRINLFFF